AIDRYHRPGSPSPGGVGSVDRVTVVVHSHAQAAAWTRDARQSVDVCLLGHDTPVRLWLAVRWVTLQVGALAKGLPEATTSPPPKATHRLMLGHETLAR